MLGSRRILAALLCVDLCTCPAGARIAALPHPDQSNGFRTIAPAGQRCRCGMQHGKGRGGGQAGRGGGAAGAAANPSWKKPQGGALSAKAKKEYLQWKRSQKRDQREGADGSSDEEDEEQQHHHQAAAPRQQQQHTGQGRPAGRPAATGGGGQGSGQQRQASREVASDGSELDATYSDDDEKVGRLRFSGTRLC